jgi:hypothetical protein
MQGLDAQSVARKKDPAQSLVIESKGEHAAQVLHAINSVFFVRVHNYFGIGVRTEAVPAGFKTLAQFLKVVDLPVEDDPDRTILVGNRLLSTFHVDDAEPPHAKGDVPCGQYALIVRPAMKNAGAHLLQLGPINDLGRLADYDSSDPTHLISFLLGKRFW